jgi:prophage regulatory protein
MPDQLGDILVPRADSAELLRKRDILQWLGVTADTLARWRRAGRFPQPLQIGPRVIRWRRSDIVAWLDTRPTARRAAEVVP